MFDAEDDDGEQDSKVIGKDGKLISNEIKKDQLSVDKVIKTHDLEVDDDESPAADGEAVHALKPEQPEDAPEKTKKSLTDIVQILRSAPPAQPETLPFPPDSDDVSNQDEVIQIKRDPKKEDAPLKPSNLPST